MGDMSVYRMVVVAEAAIILLLLFWVGYVVIVPRVVISPVERTSFAHNPDSTYEYFYEPVAGSTFKAYGAETIINSDTLNDVTTHPHQKGDEEFRIIALGDSFTFGYGVRQHETFPSVLRGMLSDPSFARCSKRIEVLNLGVPGYDLAYGVERFRLRGAAYNPDLVIWLVTQGDVMENADDTQRLMKLSSTTDSALGWDTIMQRYDLTEDVAAYQQRAIKKYKDLYSGHTLMVNFQNMYAVPNLFFESLDSAQDTLSRLNLSTRNGHPSLLDTRTDYLPDFHLNAGGNRKLAQAIAGHLLEQHMVPCERL